MSEINSIEDLDKVNQIISNLIKAKEEQVDQLYKEIYELRRSRQVLVNEVKIGD